MNTFDSLNSNTNIDKYKHNEEFAESEISGKKFASISLAGRRFTLVNVSGNETPLVDKITNKGKELIVDHTEIEVYIVGASPKITRSYYVDSYTPGKKMLPNCYSNDGLIPSKRVLAPESKSCQSCPKAVRGSKIADGRKMVACAIKKKLVVIVDDKNNPIDFEMPYLLILASGSKGNFEEYIRDKSESKLAEIPLPYFKTKISMLETDKDGNKITYPRLGFNVRAIEDDEEVLAEIKKFVKNGDKFQLVQSMLGLDEENLPMPAAFVTAPDNLEVAVLPEPKIQKNAGIDADIADFNNEEAPF